MACIIFPNFSKLTNIVKEMYRDNSRRCRHIFNHHIPQIKVIKMFFNDSIYDICINLAKKYQITT